MPLFLLQLLILAHFYLYSNIYTPWANMFECTFMNKYSFPLSKNKDKSKISILVCCNTVNIKGERTMLHYQHQKNRRKNFQIRLIYWQSCFGSGIDPWITVLCYLLWGNKHRIIKKLLYKNKVDPLIWSIVLKCIRKCHEIQYHVPFWFDN